MDSRTRRVLIADDHQDAADTLAILLCMAGHDAQVAYGGAEAIQLASTFNPEVAILDIDMPGVGGYEVAKALIARSTAKRSTSTHCPHRPL